MRRIAVLLLAASLVACGSHRSPVPHDTYRAVLDDWYDNGKFDRPHSCAAVRSALAHLPVDGPIYSTVYRDLEREERRVCG